MASFDENVANMMKAMKGKKTGGVSTTPIQTNQAAAIQQQVSQTQQQAGQLQANNQAALQQATRDEASSQYNAQKQNMTAGLQQDIQKTNLDAYKQISQKTQDSNQKLAEAEQRSGLNAKKLYQQVIGARTEMEMEAMQTNVESWGQINALLDQSYINKLEQSAELQNIKDEATFQAELIQMTLGSELTQLLKTHNFSMELLESEEGMRQYVQNLTTQQLASMANSDVKAAAVKTGVEATGKAATTAYSNWGEKDPNNTTPTGGGGGGGGTNQAESDVMI
jgi:hypothetical protein